MLLAKGKILSAVAGLAMMAIPVSAFAGGHRHENFRPAPPFAAHDRGFHNGWRNHPGAVPPPVMPVGRPMYRPAPVPYVPAPQPVGWNNGWHEEEEHEEHEWHHRPQNWHPMTNYVCDEDGDDCHYTDRGSYYSQQYQPTYNGNYSYGQPYSYGGQPESWYLAPAPSNYTPDQRLSWLIARRQRAMLVIAHLRAQGDSRGAERVVERVVNPLTQQINVYQQRVRYGYNTNSYNYVPSGYAAAPSNPLVDALAGNQGYYGNQPNNPLTTIGAVVAPMLLGTH